MNGKCVLSRISPIAHQCYSLCYSIDPWEKRWSKTLNTRMYGSRYIPLPNMFSLTKQSGYAHPSHDSKLLLISNLKDGVDEYQFPTMEKTQTFSHPIETNCILHTRILPSRNLIVTGGDNGFARVFNRINGQLVSEIHHGGSVLVSVLFSWAYCWCFAANGQLVQVVEVSLIPMKWISWLLSNVGFCRLKQSVHCYHSCHGFCPIWVESVALSTSKGMSCHSLFWNMFWIQYQGLGLFKGSANTSCKLNLVWSDHRCVYCLSLLVVIAVFCICYDILGWSTWYL